MVNRRGFSIIVAVVILVVFAILVFGSLIFLGAEKTVNVNNEDNNKNNNPPPSQADISLALEGANINGDLIEVIVKRDEGEGNLIAINFILNGPVDVGVIRKEASLAINQSETFNLSLSEAGILDPVSISVAPIYLNGENQEMIGSNIEPFSFN